MYSATSDSMLTGHELRRDLLKCGWAALALVVACAGLCPGLDLGFCVGSHDASAYIDGFPMGVERLTWHVGFVGLQAEQELGPALVGLRAAFLGNYSQTAYSDGVNWFHGRLFGADVRALAAFRKSLVADVLSADAGLALAFDCHRVYQYSDVEEDALLFTQAVTAGLRVNATHRIKVNMDMDLNLAREGWAYHFFYQEGSERFTVYDAGFMAPSFALGMLLSM